MTGEFDPHRRSTGRLPIGRPPVTRLGAPEAQLPPAPALRHRDANIPDPPASGANRRAHRVALRARAAGPFAAGIAAAFVALIAYSLLNPAPRTLTPADVNQAVASALASQTDPPPRSELVYAAIRPSLVFIQVDEPAGSTAPKGLGTGVVVNQSGAVLTALHVVDGATSITLTFADGSTSAATVVNSQPDSDIAVLQPAQPPAGVAPATLGNPASLQIGSDAFVVGNPFGLYGSLSAGVVSGLDRSYQQTDGGKVYKGLIQVDAAVNPGNSGGPLLDRDGRVVGIVTALVNPTKQDVFIGIGLAVPINVAGGGAGLPPY
ncbi:MAG TPA: trypsin-like peptidase domain-containing protein [Candidatus Limnocylindrales bacterium]|nr:trypsin-like peptidase domain-containing protein [Candidatus Limnocylindrales bacterium]